MSLSSVNADISPLKDLERKFGETAPLNSIVSIGVQTQAILFAHSF